MSEQLKYPIGKFEKPINMTEEQKEIWISKISQFPNELKRVVIQLNDEQLNCPYREGGWTVRQVVHHLADSHLNAITRFKLALTENEPTIKPYDEVAWANLPDVNSDLSSSFAILEGLHSRWTHLLRSLTNEDFNRTFFHPESNEHVQLEYALGLYAWHGEHHLNHITSLCERNGWVIEK
ncbi:bacillithiol transferase BstA [Bacillus sp. RG28]|uniref:Putative metal-dependent hydrolase J5Y03_01720 n=1 Tax=Gottfriedia endophytica TaxID=2820819 RepID=A0A940NLV0_9BACI|nr:bacillithiol transferase BstA [Gottfriedia endophytica]MBP0723900.1 bacillithiol transferase BstA [Gottfriedia endophytica]